MYHLVNCVNSTVNTIQCPSDSVMAPTNGIVSFSSLVEGGSYVYGTVATFSCSPGFGLSTLVTRTCTGTNDAEMGAFNGLSPTCDGEYNEHSFQYLFTGQYICSDHLPCYSRYCQRND